MDIVHVAESGLLFGESRELGNDAAPVIIFPHKDVCGSLFRGELLSHEAALSGS